jgi:hypothetical protein
MFEVVLAESMRSKAAIQVKLVLSAGQSHRPYIAPRRRPCSRRQCQPHVTRSARGVRAAPSLALVARSLAMEWPSLGMGLPGDGAKTPAVFERAAGNSLSYRPCRPAATPS